VEAIILHPAVDILIHHPLIVQKAELDGGGYYLE
jgi:hypothetical protein